MSNNKRPSESTEKPIRESDAEKSERLTRQWFRPDTSAAEIAAATLKAMGIKEEDHAE
jgi:hypothetical protein